MKVVQSIPSDYKLVNVTDTRKESGVYGGLWRDYESEPVETEEYVTVRTITEFTDSDGSVRLFKGQNRHQKYLCINGPKSEQKLTAQKGAEFGYCTFNRSDKGRCFQNKMNVPKVVLLHCP